ncbi:Cut8, nuclear proteasome tether protein [Rhizoctonia solani]|uniref:Tethering factor for nuclear proteasome STS1 n=1 Tax=Rhizoctonia solani TaxID=456999 RepID=A0A8H7M7M8_9AGAM|nr:Cut8, nuclear proteasome tether protein [Rhizoctonia solani]
MEVLSHPAHLQICTRRLLVQSPAQPPDPMPNGDTMTLSIQTEEKTPIWPPARPLRTGLAHSPQTHTRHGIRPKAKVSESQDAQANIDVGVLLASLPSESLLPLLTSLISSQPNLKPLVISLIPQPSVQVAIQALDASAKVIRDTYPYSQTTQPTSSTSTSFGFGSSFGAPASMHAPASTSFGFRTNSQPSGPMREDYIRSRIRPSVADFTSTATSYLSYFSLLPSPQVPSPKFTRIPS